MKTKLTFSLIKTLVLILVIFFHSIMIAQEKNKKQLKEEAKLEKQKQIALLVDCKEFIFVANSVFPQGGRMINLTDYYAVEYHLDTIKSDLPFFGIGYSSIGYGGENGMRFEGKPEKFRIEKTKKAYLIKAEVKGIQDSYLLLLSVYFDGNAHLSVNSNNRSSISYNGEIKSLEKK